MALCVEHGYMNGYRRGFAGIMLVFHLSLFVTASSLFITLMYIEHMAFIQAFSYQLNAEYVAQACVETMLFRISTRHTYPEFLYDDGYTELVYGYRCILFDQRVEDGILFIETNAVVGDMVLRRRIEFEIGTKTILKRSNV